MDQKEEPAVLVERHEFMMGITLNRPHVINALTTEMIRLIRRAVEEAEADSRFHFVLLSGRGNKGFCAGGDIKKLTTAAKENAFQRAERFFQEEYALDLYLYRFQKPVIVLADGITMGGGLGLSAGADLVIATEKTVMAMPETRIGFFPDVGATGWLFKKCPEGYPEYLALTGHELKGAECLRVGLANALTGSAQLQNIREVLMESSAGVPSGRTKAVERLKTLLDPYVERKALADPEMDQWVQFHFAGKESVPQIMDSFSGCRDDAKWCEETYRELSQRSPTALNLTLKLLRHNEDRPLEEVFAAEEKAARFIIRHPDFFEGIRAHLLDKDGRPRWQSPALELPVF